MSTSPIADIIGGILNHQQQQKIQDAITQMLNGQQADYNLSRTSLFGTGDPNGPAGLFGSLKDPTLTNLNRQLQALYGDGTDQNPGLFGQTSSRNNTAFDPSNLLSAFSNGQYDPYGQNTPGVSQANNNFNSLLPSFQNNGDFASNIFQNQGSTKESQNSFNNLDPLMSGQTGNQQNMDNAASNLLQSGGSSINPLSNNFTQAGGQGLFEGLTGSNPNLSFASKMAQLIASQGGQTAPTNSGINTALSMTGNNGMTNPLSQLSNAGGSVLSSKGGTPTNQALQGIGLNLASQPSLMSPQQAISFARDNAGSQYQKNMEQAIAQSQARGGGAGGSVANGLQNSNLADYSDKGSQAEAEAIHKALMDQQGLQLQQQQQGGQQAIAGGGLQNNTLALGGNFVQGANSGALGNVSEGLSGLNNLSSLQSNRQLSANGLLPSVAQTGFNEASTFGGLANNSNSLNLSGLNTGGTLAQDVVSGRLGANNSYNNLIGTQNSYGLGAGSLGNSSYNDMNSVIQAMLSGNLSAGNQGLNRTNSYFNNVNQGIGNNQGLMNFSGNQYNTSTNQGNNLFNSMLQYLEGNATAANQSREMGIGIIPTTNPWNSVITNFINGIGNAATGGAGGFTGGYNGG